MMMLSGDKTKFLHKIFKNEVLLATNVHNKMKCIFGTHICVWNRCFWSSSLMKVRDVIVVDVEAKRVDASMLNSTKYLSDKFNVKKFSKNVF